MGVLFGKRGVTLESLNIPGRTGRGVAAPVSRRETLQASVKWACLRLRADLVSTTPLDVYREVGGVQLEVAKPPVMLAPGGGDMEPEEWLYSTQFDLDDVGNTFGEIVARDGAGKPAMIELYPTTSVVIRVHKGVKEYRFDGRHVPTENVWHERQFTSSGSPVGFSPTAFAAMTMGGYLSAQEFAAQWFAGGAIPAVHFKNAEQVVTSEQSQIIKDRFDAQIANGGLLVTGKDWELDILGAKASEAQFLEAIKIAAPDQCRFYGVPGDMVDVESSTGSITYANVTQRNLQLLVINLGPTYIRRERKFSNRWLPAPRYAKFNTDALLRMDPAARSTKLIAEVAGRVLAPSEARGIDNRAPFTDAQLAEFDRLWPTRAPQSVPAPAPTASLSQELSRALDRIQLDSGRAAPVHVYNNVTTPDVRVEAPTSIHVDAPAIDNRSTHNIDATTALLEDSIRSEVHITQTEPAVVEPTLTRKRVETDDAGRITAIIEERA